MAKIHPLTASATRSAARRAGARPARENSPCRRADATHNGAARDQSWVGSTPAASAAMLAVVNTTRDSQSFRGADQPLGLALPPRTAPIALQRQASAAPRARQMTWMIKKRPRCALRRRRTKPASDPIARRSTPGPRDQPPGRGRSDTTPSRLRNDRNLYPDESSCCAFKVAHAVAPRTGNRPASGRLQAGIIL